MKLRDYQEECIEVLNSDRKKQLIQLPTGSGKTVIFLSYLRKSSNCSLIIVPTKDLQYQIYENALKFYHKDEIFLKGDRDFISGKKLYIVVVNTLLNEKSLEFFKNESLDHIIIDEAHRSLSNTYKKFLNAYTEFNPNFKLIGFTATPERLDRKSLLSIFEKITYTKTIYDLINEGYLCDLKAYRIKTLQNIISKGIKDFQPIELRILDNYSRNHLIYKTYFENCLGKKTLIFCISVDHAEKMADYLRKEKGVKAYHISGRQTMKHRQELLMKFKCGEIHVLLTCQLLTEGFDEPSIEAIIIARPTRSKSLYCQMLGRGTRLNPGKKFCEIYELTDNTHKICTFNVAADENKEVDFISDYSQGIFLSSLHKEISEISLEDYVLQKKEINLISDFESYLKSEGILDYQKKSLDENEMKFLSPINLLEASFMIFFKNLRIRYGYN